MSLQSGPDQAALNLVQTTGSCVLRAFRGVHTQIAPRAGWAGLKVESSVRKCSNSSQQSNSTFLVCCRDGEEKAVEVPLPVSAVVKRIFNVLQTLNMKQPFRTTYLARRQ